MKELFTNRERATTQAANNEYLLPVNAALTLSPMQKLPIDFTAQARKRN
jgi:hypothetical protein